MNRRVLVVCAVVAIVALACVLGFQLFGQAAGPGGERRPVPEVQRPAPGGGSSFGPGDPAAPPGDG